MAAISDVWYAYHSSHIKNLELFPKTQINNHGNDEHGGIIWEWDPARHRQVAKKLSPAFSGRALKAKEPTLHKYIDLFVERMKAVGGATQVKEPPYLSLLKGFSKAVTVIQVSWRFPFLAPLKYIFLLLTAMRPHSHIRDHSRQQLERRIRRRGAVQHLDFFEQLIPEDGEPPKDRKEMRHLEQVAGQLLAAGFEPPSLWLYFTLYYLAVEPGVREALIEEVRNSFQSYDEITAGTAASLPYLTACLKESIRMMPNLPSGLPVVSPGAMVDGTFIPKGPLCFRPERWLPEDHPLYDRRFEGDNRKGFHPFSQGPRICTGREIAWWQSRLFIAKVLWTFDLEMVRGQQVNIDRDLRGWGIYQKPEVYVRFVLGAHNAEKRA
ncbi:cytochrome P450 [Hypoxylon sp. EC38]|nr:cytochrome P450 [Hypoxylon sp. EC38]